MWSLVHSAGRILEQGLAVVIAVLSWIVDE